MGEHMVFLLARFKAQSGKEDALLILLESVVMAARNELGCVEYELHKENNKRGHFVFFKKFVDNDAYEKHQNTIHYKRLMREAPKLISTQPEIIILSKHL
ncbi:antibiotic biosynthesis monooxygenase [Shewanella sp. D64]|uniref:putative quinol monooxygenase n=1 Tax=unclassified Shewanella TaxID=196818 RepID=UPI0022BA4B11|nr:MULTISPECIES: putative quinol monooxygenase [unclassified Shewanella]MEC4724483.1 antibiotic biosynthesis monooxygenase [Shewanella sp. D64]MEC4736740.1 antibiotic biosynthesis monooxygenase [Shewanella sp. E94]WBJ94594.1 antibiotic biosynthesis monooxygenase [Shewanella sp. MTB7]